MHERCSITIIRRRVHHRSPLLSSRLGDYRFQFARVSWKFSRSLNRRRGSTTITFTFHDRGGFEDGFPTGVGEVFRGCSTHLCLGNLVSQKREGGNCSSCSYARVIFNLIWCIIMLQANVPGNNNSVFYFLDFFGNKTEWMFGKTPPEAMVTVPNNLDNSSSFRMANWMCLGTILDFLLSLEAFPASSRTSAAKYSNTAAK